MNEAIHSYPMEQFEPRARALMELHPTDDGTDDDNLASSILSSAPRLSTRYNSFSASPLRAEELWTMREVANGEEQLYAKGRSAYWTRNSMIIKSFNFTDQVVRVFWTSFGDQEHVCIALVSGLSIFDRVGRHFQILLPFAYTEMYATSLGLIIERNCREAEDPALPVHFALTHPTREISPVIFKPLPRTNSLYDKPPLSYALPMCMSIVDCHRTLPYCLVYNSHDMQHSIWRLRHTTPQEDEEFVQTHAIDESTANGFAQQQSNCSFRTEGMSHGSLNISSRQKSNLLHQSHHSSTATTTALNNFSPRIDFKNRHSTLGNLAASRLGAGCGQLTTADINLNTNATNIKSFNSAHTFNTISTPNRNRMINYLRDNIEEPILPELVLEQIWTEPSSTSSKATKFFTMTDLANDEYAVIVMSSSSQIKVIKRDNADRNPESWTLGRNSILTGLDAAAIPSMSMMLVLDATRNFALYSGFDKVAPISVGFPQYTPTTNVRMMPSSSPAAMKTPFDMSPIHSSSARKRSSMADRSSVGSEVSFQQMFHTLSPVPHAGKHESKTSSPVCSSDVRKIKYVIGNSVIVSSGANSAARFDIPSVYQTSYVNRILRAVKAMVSKDLGLTIISRWYRTRRASMQPELLRAKDELNLFNRWFIRLLGIEKNVFEGDEISNLQVIGNYPSPVKMSRRTKDLDANPILASVNSLFYAIHLVFEDLSVMKLNHEIVSSLAEFLLILASLLKLAEYQEYYYSRFPELRDIYHHREQELGNLIPKLETLYKPAFIQTNPPSIDDFIKNISNISVNWDSLDSSEVELQPYPNIRGVTENSFSVIALFCEMFSVQHTKALIDLSATATKPVPLTLEERPQRSKEADQKLVEMMVKLGKDLNYLSGLPESISSYFREAVLNSRESPPSIWCEACYSLIGRFDLVDLVSGRSRNLDNKNNTDSGDDETLKLLFQDFRVSEAIRMLSSDAPIEFSVVQRRGATDEESREEILRNLYMLNVRTMAMPIGRGAISLRTYSPVIGESFEVPKLELSGKNLSEDRLIEYTHDTSVYPWPYFHNGVAAGLSICAPSSNNIIDSTWINYNRPRSNIPHGVDHRDRESVVKNIDNEHAGFLLALGLNGHLEKLSLMAIHDYLCQNNDLTKLAILLGMSAAKRGTRDVNIIKVLSIHIDALLPPNSTELDVSAPVHAASIIGVGLLYQGSGDSHISRILLEEIGRLPGPEANSHIDRESYSLSAGLAFGLVNLCKGDTATITSSDQLRLYMLGGKRKPLTIAQKERYFKQDCHRGEESYINTHITSPGGTLGLGLMYHRSSNKSVANWMRAPDTQTLLEYVRPDFLLLRMISYGLIMWEEVTPDEVYISSHMPKIVHAHTFERLSSSSGLTTTPCTNSNIDHELISQAGCNIVAGCCMAIALKFAGTADKRAYNTIYEQTKLLITMSNNPVMAERAGRPCIEACLNVLVTALAVVMAGTGDLGVNRICRYLRSRLTQSCVFYGSYMAVHLALGILFLGACRYSLSTSPESIGALVCSLYPIYPNHSSDNRYHLQALRHLYVLAAEPRLLIPRDILSNKPVYVDITVRQRQSDGKVVVLKLRAPCLMPEVDTIEKVCIDDERYWRIEIDDKKALIKCLLQQHGFLSVNPRTDSSQPSRQALHSRVLPKLKQQRD